MSRYRSPSTARHVRAVLFDTFGTVVDWRTGISAAVESFAGKYAIAVDAEPFAMAWRAQYQPSMQAVRSGARPFVTLDVLHRGNLEAVLQTKGFDVGNFAEDDVDALARSWRWLPPWPDSVGGITRLKTHYVVGPLSNGHTALLVDMAKFAGLPWDLVLGSDISRAYKPEPEAYLAPARLLDLAPGEVMLVAAHNGDLQAAQQAGLATGFVARPDEYGPDQTADIGPTGEWDVTASSITELAERLEAGVG